MTKSNNIEEKIKQLYDNMKQTYIPDTYSKVSMYFPIMAAMELSTGKSVLETLVNRAIVTGTDMLNGALVGVSCDIVRKICNAQKEGPQQKIVDTVTSIAVLDAAYFVYQQIACLITNRSTETIAPACASLAAILLFTGGEYGVRRNNCRKDYSITGSTVQKTKKMIINDYYRIKNRAITDLNYYLCTLS